MSEMFNNDDKDEKMKIYLMIAATVVVVIAVIAVVIIFFFPKKKENAAVETKAQATTAEVETLKLSPSTTAQQTTATSAVVQDTTASEYEKIFDSIDDKVTAKDSTNLRKSYYDNSDVVATLTYGDYVQRTGYNDNGWSRLIYDGEVVYAKTQLLLKEGETPATIASWPDQFDMTWQDVNEQVTAKDETNLRTTPTFDDSSAVYTVLKKGTYVTRVGLGDKGWSKISYDGQILYAVTSYLTK